MRVNILLLATVAAAQESWLSIFTKLTLPSDVARQVEALNDDDFISYAAQHGMNLTYHEAVTADGWILQLWRVRSMEIYDAKLSTPVIVCHGFGSSSFDYMWNLRNESTAFVLADNGYDVWMPNFRANQFSDKIMSNGKARKPKPQEYFRASWQYMAERDLPTIFDKVLSETKQPKFYLMGHSMGTTVPFAFLSENHSYDDKLLHFSAVVPVLKFGDDTALDLKLALTNAPTLIESLQINVPVVRVPFEKVFNTIFGRQLAAADAQGNKLESFLQSAACGLAPPVCGLVLGLLFNRELYTDFMYNPHLNKTRSAIYFSKTPAGITAMTAYNYGHEWKKQPWEKIDFKKLPLSGITNEGEYKSSEPPTYNFGALKVPYSLFYVKNDVFTGVATAKKVIAELNATDYKFIDGNNLNHMDSVVAVDTRCYTTNDIMSKFQVSENARDNQHREYRIKVEAFVNSLPFKDGCVGLGA